MAFISIKNLTKVYESNDSTPKVALKDLNLDISSGCFAALAGPSGSGKTTLLNLIGGLDYPTTGSVEIGGKIISNLPERQLSEFRLNSIGFIFQAYNLVPVLTAKENMEYIMILLGISEEIRESSVAEISKRLGIESLLDRKPSEMSGGQQQRVAVARAILSEPKVILADEPTANLDSENSRELLKLMRQLNEEKSMSFLISSHDPLVVEMTRERILLQDGRLSNAPNSDQ